MAQPLSVVVTDSNGNALTITGSTILTDAARIAANQLIGAPEAVVLCDVNGNPLQLQNGGLFAMMSLMQGTVALPGLTSVQVPLTTLASGDNYIFTVPAGMRAYVQVSLYNPTGGSITFNVRVSKDGGVTSWRDGSNVVVNTLTATWCSSSLILEAGDKFNINCTALGLVGMGMSQQFLNTAQIKQVVFTAFASGDNVVYTCPAGKHAVIPMSEARGTAFDTNGQAFLSNETGGTVTFHLSVKPSGGASTQVSNAGSVLTNVDAAVTANQFSTTLNPGDQFILNTNSSTAGQAFRCNVYEF